VRILKGEVDRAYDARAMAYQDGRIAAAARELIRSLDHTYPEWRANTLVDGDEANDAWRALVAAVEGR
jgi:hypothetical protein